MAEQPLVNYETKFRIACENGDIEEMNSLYAFECARKRVNTLNINGKLKLAWNGNLEVLKRLVEMGADVNNCEGEPLCEAAYNGHFAIVKFLVEKGAMINVRDNNPKHAKMLDKEEKRERKKKKMDDWDRLGWPSCSWGPISSAVAGGHTKIVEYLIKNSSTPLNERLCKRLAFIAIDKDHIELVKFFTNTIVVVDYWIKKVSKIQQALLVEKAFEYAFENKKIISMEYFLRHKGQEFSDEMKTEIQREFNYYSQLNDFLNLY
jgi:hypothetical protein